MIDATVYILRDSGIEERTATFDCKAKDFEIYLTSMYGKDNMDNVDNVDHMAHMKSMDNMKSIDDMGCDGGTKLRIKATDEGQDPDPPIGIDELKSRMNDALQDTNVTWDWKKYFRPIGEKGGDINDCFEEDPRHCDTVIKSVKIILHNING